jgi:hypothetical protein
MAVRNRQTIRLLAPLAAVVVVRVGPIQEETTPPADAFVKPGPLDLRFRYNRRIDPARSRLTLIWPDRTRDIAPAF